MVTPKGHSNRTNRVVPEFGSQSPQTHQFNKIINLSLWYHMLAGARDQEASMIFLSVDMDGTMEFAGGPVPLEPIRDLYHKGAIEILSAGLGDPEEQIRRWKQAGLILRDAVEKPDLLDFPHAANPYYIKRFHVGNSTEDQELAAEAGFEYCTPHDLAQNLIPSIYADIQARVQAFRSKT